MYSSRSYTYRITSYRLDDLYYHIVTRSINLVIVYIYLYTIYSLIDISYTTYTLSLDVDTMSYRH